MLPKDPKEMVGLLVRRKMGDEKADSPPKEDDGGGEYDSHYRAAAQATMDALKGGDLDGFMRNFKTMMRLCEMEPSEEPGEEDEPE